MFIAEKGLEIETREVNLLKNEQLSEAFLAVNPRATVPVLITDEGRVLTENNAIATYLEACFPEPALMGSTPDEKGAISMWNAIAEQQGGMAIAEVLRNSHPSMKHRALPGPLDLEQIPELAERGRKRAAAFFDLLENQLGQSTFVATDSFSQADITAFVFIGFARVIKMRIPEANTATQAWFDKVGQRASANL